jgi:hypothetical protein
VIVDLSAAVSSESGGKNYLAFDVSTGRKLKAQVPSKVSVMLVPYDLVAWGMTSRLILLKVRRSAGTLSPTPISLKRPVLGIIGYLPT